MSRPVKPIHLLCQISRLGDKKCSKPLGATFWDRKILSHSMNDKLGIFGKRNELPSKE